MSSKIICFFLVQMFTNVFTQTLNKNQRINDINAYNQNPNVNNQNPNYESTNKNPLYDNNPYSNKNYQYQYTTFGGTNSLNGNINEVDQSYFCPEHWKVFRNSCLRFIRSPKRTWLEAKRICEAYKGELVNIDTHDKHEFITKELIVNNQRQNRYFISARQLSLRNWVNEDNTQLFQKDDSIISLDEINEWDLENNLNDPQNNNNNYNNFNNNNNNNNNNKNNNNNNNFYINQNNQYDRLLQKDRLVYGFSPSKDRWVFIPSYDHENNLFICESTELYSPNNINLIADDKRAYDYGIEVVDIEKVPRGPYFISQPKSTTFDTVSKKLFNEVVVQCLAGGHPTPTYLWFKEEFVNDLLTHIPIDPIENSRYIISGGNLIITNPEQAKDQGTYHCVAENEYGRILSESVQINFGFIREFNFDRAIESADMNWGKAIYCDPPAHYPDNIKYYWSRDFFPNFVDEDQRVFVSSDGSLYFSAIETVDRANYSCTVQSIDSDTGRNGPFFQLRVKQKSNYQQLIFANSFPKIFPEAPVAGQDIRLECMAFGYPVPFYNWTRKDGVLPRNSYLHNYNRVLIIQNATINDNGEYICTAKNDRKALSNNVVLNIQMEPNFTIPLKDKIKDFNTEVTFTCEAFAIPDVNYTWYKNAEQLDIEKLDRDKYTIQDNILTIKYLTPDKDDGMYQCRAQNQLRGVFSSGQLRVLAMKPSFKKHPLESEIYAIYNGNTTIDCEPEAAPRPKITWKKDGNIIGAGGHRRISPMGKLVISPTSRDDEGIYTCVATNIYGSDESSSRLVVLQELRFTQTLRPRIITHVGELLWLRCEVVYDEILDVSFIWTHNEQPMRSDTDERITIDYNTLEIKNISVLDTGDYECVVSTSVNEIRSKSNVVVQGPPGAPGGVKVIDIRKVSAVLEWIDGSTNGRPIQFYEILGRTNWNRTWGIVGENAQAMDFDRLTGRKRADVTGLTPWSGYEFSVRAANDLGLGIPSLPSPLFSTQSDKPYRAPRNLSGGGGKIGDLTITWDPLLPQEQNGRGIYYKVFWRLHEKDPEWASKIIKPPPNEHPSKIPGEDLGNAVVHVPSDNYYLQYDVKVQAFNELGHGPESDPAVIYSAEDMPQVAPQQPVARGYNSTALNVTWMPVDIRRDNMRGKLIGHRLKYWKRDHAEEDAIYYLSRSIQNWALVVGLEPDTYYFVKVMVYNSAGEGPESEKYLERTYRKAPQKPPSAVHVFGVDPSTVRVVWRYVSPALDEEPVSGYKVRVWEADRDMSTANDTYISLGSKLECYVDKLTPGKAYKLRVLAYSNGGDGRMSSPTHHFQMGATTAKGSSAVKLKIDSLNFCSIIILLISTVYTLV